MPLMAGLPLQGGVLVSISSRGSRGPLDCTAYRCPPSIHGKSSPRCPCALCLPAFQRMLRNPQQEHPEQRQQVLREPSPGLKKHSHGKLTPRTSETQELGFAHVHLNALILKIKSHDISIPVHLHTSDSSNQFALVQPDLLSSCKYLSNCFTELCQGSYTRMSSNLAPVQRQNWKHSSVGPRPSFHWHTINTRASTPFQHSGLHMANIHISFERQKI